MSFRKSIRRILENAGKENIELIYGTCKKRRGFRGPGGSDQDHGGTEQSA